MRTRSNKSLRIVVGIYKQHFRIFDTYRSKYSIVVAKGFHWKLQRNLSW